MYLLTKLKNNKAQISNTTIWIILVLFVMFISFYFFSEKIDLFNTMVGLDE